MKTRILIVESCLLSFVAGSALAKGGKPEPPPGEPYSGYAVMCAMLDPGVYMEDDKYGHLRDAVMLYRIITDSPYTTGWETLMMNYDIRIKSGKGVSWGYLEMEPDAFSGTFEEFWSATAKRFVWDISGEYIGQGDLEGISATYELTPGDIEDVPPDTCGGGPILDVQEVTGYVILPE